MTTAAQHAAIPAATNGRPSRTGSIGRRVSAILMVAVLFGFVVVVGVQIFSERARIYEEVGERSEAITELLASQIRGGVRWGKADVVGEAYAKLAGDPSSRLSNLLTLKANGDVLTRFASASLAPFDIAAALKAEPALLTGKALIQRRIGRHIFVVAPILSGKERERIGTLVTAWSLDDVNAAILHNALTSAVTSAAIVAGLIGLLMALMHYVVSRPLKGITASMTRLAEGELETEIPARDRRDEIGAMARALQVFKENLAETRRLQAETREAERRALEEERRREEEKREAERREAAERERAAEAQARRAARIEALIEDFNKETAALLQGVSTAASALRATADTMTETAQQTSVQSSAVAAASEQAATNVQTVASAAEELASSVHEIGRQVEESAKIARNAADDARRTDVKVQGLAEAAQKIGEVVNLINDIASQTNLLTLNATIEAARAGEAGKGFAVVASEVKSLADQTAKATEEIAAQITAIQGSTSEAVEAIKGISATIEQINEIASSIASAVEEQGAATREIAGNVQQAARGTQEISASIGRVSEASSATGASAGQVHGAAEELARQGDSLSQRIARFIEEVRAA